MSPPQSGVTPSVERENAFQREGAHGTADSRQKDAADSGRQKSISEIRDG